MLQKNLFTYRSRSVRTDFTLSDREQQTQQQQPGTPRPDWCVLQGDDIHLGFKKKGIIQHPSLLRQPVA